MSARPAVAVPAAPSVPTHAPGSGPLLAVEDLHVEFRSEGRVVRAVRGLSYHVDRGETLGLVGESGSGKSVSALALMGLLPSKAGRVTQGSARLEGRELIGLPDDELRTIRGARIAMVFQDPLSSLNPVLTIGRQITETLEAHTDVTPAQARTRAIELLEMVGIPAARLRIDDHPHQLSGGMRQRAMLAIALACEPSLLIADEPTTALDVTIQAQILDLLQGLRRELGMAVLLITHDLGVVAGFADRLAVMYAGGLVETGTTGDVLARSAHPYTVGLLRSLPRLDRPQQDALTPIEGSPPDLTATTAGCPFAPRCGWRVDTCWTTTPVLALAPLRDGGAATSGADGGGVAHRVACHHLPTAAEAAAGEPAAGFVPAAIPGAVLTAAEAEARPADEEALVIFADHHGATVSARRAHDAAAAGAGAGAADGARAARAAPPAPPVLLSVDGLSVHFPITAGILRRQVGAIRAVDGVGFTIGKGETLGLVGESGSGKTTIGRAIVRLNEPVAGRVMLDGADLLALRGEALRKARRRFQMVFQDPYSSLDPRQTVGQILAAPLRVHGIAEGAARTERVAQLLELVGLDPAFVARYPHEFSGGQRQRIGIARALAVEPEVLVCDEPISALDVSIQAQVINLLEQLQDELGLTYLFIAHDLAVVRHIAERVAVLYLGRIAETGPSPVIYADPLHPYTIALLSAVPVPDAETERRRRRIILTGDIPSPAAPPSGCRFHTRCWLRERLGRPERCATEEPPLVAPVPSQPDRVVACHFPDEARAERPGSAAETATAG